MPWKRPETETDLEELYDHIYRNEPKYGHVVGRHRLIFKAIKERVGAGETILDAGCGRGGFIRMLSSAGFHVTGTEVSWHLINNDLKGLFVSHLRYEDFDALETDSFDAVVSSDVLEHLVGFPMVDRALNQLARVAKKYLFVTTAKHVSRNFSGSLDIEKGEDWNGDLHLIHASRDLWRDHIARVMEIEEEHVDERGNTFFFFGTPKRSDA